MLFQHDLIILEVWRGKLRRSQNRNGNRPTTAEPGLVQVRRNHQWLHLRMDMVTGQSRPPPRGARDMTRNVSDPLPMPTPAPLVERRASLYQ